MKYKLRFSLFFAGMILFQMSANFAHPMTPTIIQELALPDYMFGLMLAATMLSNFLFSPFWGKINATMTSRQSLLLCCCGNGNGGCVSNGNNNCGCCENNCCC